MKKVSLVPIFLWVGILIFQSNFYETHLPFLWSDFPYRTWEKGHAFYECNLKGNQKNLKAVITDRRLNNQLFLAAHSSKDYNINNAINILKKASWEPKQESFLNAPFFISITKRFSSKQPRLTSRFQEVKLSVYGLTFNAETLEVGYIPRHQRFLLL